MTLGEDLPVRQHLNALLALPEVPEDINAQVRTVLAKVMAEIEPSKRRGLIMSYGIVSSGENPEIHAQVLPALQMAAQADSPAKTAVMIEGLHDDPKAQAEVLKFFIFESLRNILVEAQSDIKVLDAPTYQQVRGVLKALRGRIHLNINKIWFNVLLFNRLEWIEKDLQRESDSSISSEVLKDMIEDLEDLMAFCDVLLQHPEEIPTPENTDKTLLEKHSARYNTDNESEA